jgi:uncharacterized membrane-anchored protein
MSDDGDGSARDDAGGAVWQRCEGTLSIHSTTTRHREIFYWLAVMMSFALGTAAGDLTAFYLGWGFIASILFLGVALVVPRSCPALD